MFVEHHNPSSSLVAKVQKHSMILDIMYGETREERVVPWKRFIVDVVREYCDEHDITLELLSGDWIMRMTKGSEQRYIFGPDFGLNSSVSKLLARDKSATSEVLAYAQVPHIEHRLFLRPGSLGSNPHGNWESLQTCFQEFNNDVVCKPNDGSAGLFVARAQTSAEFETAIHELFVQSRTVAVSPYYPIESEYRITMVDHNAELIYEKVKADDEELKFNLSNGSQAHEVTDPALVARLQELATNATRALNIRLANVDIARVGNELSILEVNGSVSFENYAQQGPEEERKARAVYKKVIDLLFA